MAHAKIPLGMQYLGCRVQNVPECAGTCEAHDGQPDYAGFASSLQTSLKRWCPCTVTVLESL